MKKNWFKALLSIAFANLIGITSSFLSGDIRSKYTELIKPFSSPPGWVFGLVWPVLFLLMGYSAYRVYENRTDDNKRYKALGLYAFQLFLNFSWSIVFFRFGSFWGGLIIIILLDVFVLKIIQIFRKIDKMASYLMIPYLIWLFFATYLNAAIIALN